jgi:hypothetical protein
MKTQQLRESFLKAMTRAIWPGETLVPQEIVQNGCFDCERRGQQVVHL